MRALVVSAAACLAAAGLVSPAASAHGTAAPERASAAPTAHGLPGVGSTAPVAARAGAGAVTLGQVATAPGTACNPPPLTLAQYLESTSTPSYVASVAGIITSYSVRAGANPGLARLVVLGPSATAGHRTVVALSAQNPVALNTLNTFPTRIPVTAGLSIGLSNNSSAMICYGVGEVGEQLKIDVLDPAVTTDFPGSFPVANSRVNISAVLEPDADGDQFGDLSQDLCPQSKLTQAACPAPDTSVTKKPKKSSTHRTVTIEFTSTVPGSTFTCAVDGKAAVPCVSPFKKRFKVGEHTVVITAINAVGFADATPVTVPFKVTKPKR